MDSLIIERQSTSPAKLYRLVRDFVAKTPVWGTATRYQTKPDERSDLTLVSERVYGRRDEYLVVAAAAGLESVEELLPEQLLTLPTEEQLRAIKARAGFVNLDRQRGVEPLPKNVRITQQRRSLQAATWTADTHVVTADATTATADGSFNDPTRSLYSLLVVHVLDPN